MRLACIVTAEAFAKPLAEIARTFDIPLLSDGDAINNIDYLFSFNNGALQLSPSNKAKGGPLLVDFHSAAMEYRRASAGIQQDIAKAAGCKPGYRPQVLDVTAGLGKDAFVLAGMGCDVTLVEQNTVIYALLEDGLRRAMLLDNTTANIVKNRMHLLPRQNALDYLATDSTVFDVVYLDPMFPERQKSAKVKKAMQYFHDIVGCADEQDIRLFDVARQRALKRIVVKRPRLAPLLAGQKPDYQVKGKSVRYDIYLTVSKA